MIAAVEHLVEIGVCRSAAAALQHAEPCLVAHGIGSTQSLGGRGSFRPLVGIGAQPFGGRGPGTIGAQPFSGRGPRILEIAPKKVAHEYSVLLDDMECPVLDPVAKRNHSAHPDALLLRRGDLVPDAFAGELALELGEGQQDVQGQSPHAGCRVERLRASAPAQVKFELLYAPVDEQWKLFGIAVSLAQSGPVAPQPAPVAAPACRLCSSRRGAPDRRP